MKYLLKQETVKIPESLKATVKSRCVTLTGDRGSLTREFKHLGVNLFYVAATREIKVEMWMIKKKQAACLKSVATHIENMITGLLRGYRYVMRAACEHFPISFSIQDGGKTLYIRNFLGEKNDRKIIMHEGVIVKKKSEDAKDEIIIEGNNVELVGLSCALIHQSVLVKKKDIRKFLDGVYITERGHMVAEEE